MKSPENHDLYAFLAGLTALTEENETWFNLPLRIRAYLGSALPPDRYISSIRGIVLRDVEVLTLRNPDNYHTLPGGQREPGESLFQTLSRELLEEAGWTVREPDLLGFIHYRHLGPRPDDYGYLYPDFCQAVYRVYADSAHPEAKIVDDYEQEAVFLPIGEALRLPLTARNRLFLEALRPD